MTLVTSLPAQALTIVADDSPMLPVIIPGDASTATREAAEDLALYLHKITGAKPTLIEGMPKPLPASAIWVGMQPQLDKLFPGQSLTFNHPEEILFIANNHHLLIAGRDSFQNDTQSEFGTANAVYTFLQKHLNVRWLWPGELGEDIQPQSSVSFEPFTYRYNPPLRERRFHYPRNLANMAEHNHWWKVQQRGRDSLHHSESHSFYDWWEKYNKSNPEYFALQPNGTRTPLQHPKLIKLCISNPAVAKQWLDNAEQTIKENPSLTLIGAMPNDSGGWCVCDNCKSWDHPDTPDGVLTDRYVRFWNILARGLKERFPNRDLMLNVLAYSRNRNPPIGVKLEDNICIGYVGNFPITSAAERKSQKDGWSEWSAMASKMRYRPNLFWYSGGMWGFPTYEPQNTIEDFKFIANDGCVGLEVDSAFMNWSVLGPQLYLLAQLAYEPNQDGQALLTDYFQRGFGPAAEIVQSYFDLMHKAHQDIVAAENYRSGSISRFNVLITIETVYGPAYEKQAGELLDQADAAVKDQPLYKQRVAFLRAGLEFVALQRDILIAMRKVRESSGMDADAIAKAVELCKQRDELAEKSPRFAIDYKRILSHIRLREMEDYLGPPSNSLKELASNQNAVQYEAPKWAIVFEDHFDRETLGENWELSNPQNARIEDGHLILNDTTLLTAKSYPGLHRIEFYVTGLPDSQGRYGDLSPLIHASSNDISTGYFLQFGGIFNSFNSIRRLGKINIDNRSHKIRPDVQHRIIAEFNGSNVRLSIDNRTIMRYRDAVPLVGKEHERLGLYVWSGAKIDWVRILTGPAVPIKSPLNDPDFE